MTVFQSHHGHLFRPDQLNVHSTQSERLSRAGPRLEEGDELWRRSNPRLETLRWLIRMVKVGLGTSMEWYREYVVLMLEQNPKMKGITWCVSGFDRDIFLPRPTGAKSRLRLSQLSTTML